MEISEAISIIAVLAIFAVLIGCVCAFFCKRHRIGSVSSAAAAVLLIVLRFSVPGVSEFGGSVKFTLVWYGALLLLALAATAYKWLPLVINMEPEVSSRESNEAENISGQNKKSPPQESTQKTGSERCNSEPQNASEVQETVVPETELRFCRHCGNPIKPGMKFCSRCGKPL